MGLEDTSFGAIFTRPQIRGLITGESGVTLVIAKGFIHVSAVITQGLCLSSAGIAQPYATVIVAREEGITYVSKLASASIRALVAPIVAICPTIATLYSTVTPGTVFTLI